MSKKDKTVRANQTRRVDGRACCPLCTETLEADSNAHIRRIEALAWMSAQPHARVDQCLLCHQTTSWNDIRGVGWYKHH